MEKEAHPDLELDPLVLPEDGLHFKVDAHRADECRREGVVRVTEQEGSLADAAVADDEQLEHVVKVLIGRVLRPTPRRRHLVTHEEARARLLSFFHFEYEVATEAFEDFLRMLF